MFLLLALAFGVAVVMEFVDTVADVGTVVFAVEVVVVDEAAAAALAFSNFSAFSFFAFAFAALFLFAATRSLSAFSRSNLSRSAFSVFPSLLFQVVSCSCLLTTSSNTVVCNIVNILRLITAG